jgi:F-type H+-transporting ATPase subunit gamma
MPSFRDVQNKIGAVKKTKQITKAMNMVASAKLRNAQSRIERFRPYAEKFYEMLRDLASGVDPSVHPLLEKREEVHATGILLITSDRGLCGSFNHNLTNLADKIAQEKAGLGREVKFYCIGKKGRDYARKSQYELVQGWPDAMNNFDFALANEVGTMLIDRYLTGELDEVIMVFGEFQSMARQVPVDLNILPLATAEEEGEGGGQPSTEYIYEPSVEGLLSELLPRFIKAQVYRGLLDTSCSEHAARMTAMDNATRACDDMIDSLTLLYNKTRQAAITTELMDIVGGAEALKG